MLTQSVGMSASEYTGVEAGFAHGCLDARDTIGARTLDCGSAERDDHTVRRTF